MLGVLMSSELLTPAQADALADAILESLDRSGLELGDRVRARPVEPTTTADLDMWDRWGRRE